MIWCFEEDSRHKMFPHINKYKFAPAFVSEKNDLFRNKLIFKKFASAFLSNRNIKIRITKLGVCKPQPSVEHLYFELIFPMKGKNQSEAMFCELSSKGRIIFRKRRKVKI